MELILEGGVTIIVNAQLTGRLSILGVGPGRQGEHEIERKGCLERKVERKTKQETEVEKEREQRLSHPAQKFPGLPQPREQSPAEGSIFGYRSERLAQRGSQQERVLRARTGHHTWGPGDKPAAEGVGSPAFGGSRGSAGKAVVS